jgi:hypothetical protein
MKNLFPPHRDIHETYDLKGSTAGREYPEEKARQNPRAVLKDLNWINRGKMLELGPEKRALLTEQLRRDAEFLKTVNVMDYSLLVGIHNMRRGNRDNVRKNTLKVFSVSLLPPSFLLLLDTVNSQISLAATGKLALRKGYLQMLLLFDERCVTRRQRAWERARIASSYRTKTYVEMSVLISCSTRMKADYVQRTSLTTQSSRYITLVSSISLHRGQR